MNMKMTTIAVVVAGALASSATMAESYSFAGPYAGVSVGLTNFTTDTADYWCWITCDAPGNSEQAVQATFTAGYNWQMDETFVLGVEADFSTGMKSSEVILDFNNRIHSHESEWNWVATLRTRAGLSVNKALVYVTGGLALADAEFSLQRSTPTPRSAAWDGSITGLVGGAGIEYALTDGVRMKVEYLTTSMDKKNACIINNGTPQCSGAQNDSRVHWTTSSSTVRAGVNWNF